jgi:DNA-binding LytR/AlgR family response regulator
LKPILEEDLAGAVEKFKSFIPSNNDIGTQDIKQLIRKEKSILSRVLVKIGYNLKIVQTQEISCFFSENKIVYLQTEDRTYPSDFTLDELEDSLEEKKFFGSTDSLSSIPIISKTSILPLITKLILSFSLRKKSR